MFLLRSKMARKILAQSSQMAEEETCTILLPTSILRKAIRVQDAVFSFQASFPDNCAQSVVPGRIKYFFRQLLEGLNPLPIKKIPERVYQINKINHGLLQSTSTMILFCRDVRTPQRVAINGANVWGIRDGVLSIESGILPLSHCASTSFRQLTMFNMGSLSTNLKCGLLYSKVTFANEEQQIGGIVT